MALYFMRQPGDIAANVWAATARANRALTLLKQASQGMAPSQPHKRAREGLSHGHDRTYEPAQPGNKLG
jgi:hypothetical protein